MFTALILSALPALASGWTFVDAPPGDHSTKVHDLGDRLVAMSIGLPKVSDDGGTTWRTSGRGMPTNAVCATSDDENGILLAYCSGRFYRSTDRGESWVDWSEGFTTDADITPYYNLALGDSAAVFMAGFEEEMRLWTRSGNGPWKRIPRMNNPGTSLLWTGGAFLLDGVNSVGQPLLLRSLDGWSWKSQVLGGEVRSIAARNDTTWLIIDSALTTSLDHGSSWLPGKPAVPATQILASRRGLYGSRNDSIVSIDPRTGSTRLIRVVRDGFFHSTYSSPLLEVLTFWSGPSIVSTDSGRTWSPQRRPESGRYVDAFARHDGSWFADGSEFWSRKDGAPWAETDTLWASSFRAHEGVLFAGGYRSHSLVDGVWKPDTLTRPNDDRTEGHLRWIEGMGVPAQTDGDYVWVRDPGQTRWRRLANAILRGANANRAVGFASRLWFAEHTFREYLEDCLFSFDTTTGVLTPIEIPHYEGAYEIAVSGRTLWVATDMGLFRSDDTGKSFQDAGLPSPWNNFASVNLLVRGDTIVSTLQTMAMRIPDSPERATWISFDNGRAWTRDPDTSLVADAFFCDGTGLYAFMTGHGIHRWDASGGTGVSNPRAAPARTFSLRGSNGIWTLVGAPGETIEIRDTLGKLVASTTLDPRGLSEPIALPSGVHFLSSTSPTKGRTLSLVVP